MRQARIWIFLLPLFFLTACFSKSQPPARVSAYGSTDGVGSLGVHTVQDGDTVWTISQRYDLAMRDLVSTNNLQAPYRLAKGQRLRLPPPYEYRARTGDSIYTVSRLFRVGSSDLARLNNLHAPYRITPGQIIKLPATNARAVASIPGLIDAPPGEVASVSTVTSEPLAPIGNSPPAATASAQISPPVASTPAAPYETASIPPQPEPQVEMPSKPARNNPITAETPKRSSGKFLKPVKGRVISTYGPKEGGLHNDGINIEAPRGTPVHSAENGVVVYAGNKLKGSGNLVLVRHEGRWMSAYGHMDSIKVKRGDVVKYGQQIGTVGATGSVDKPQLHFELRRGTEALNPQAYLEG